MKFGTLAALAALGLSVAVTAAAAEPAVGAKLNFRDKKAVDRWVAETKIVQNTTTEGVWKQIAAAPEGLYLGRQALENTVNPDIKKYVTRLELFEPINDEGRVISSVSFDREIDCTHATMRMTLTTSYTSHNLAGQPLTEKIDEPWSPVAGDPMIKSVFNDFCDQAKKSSTGSSAGMIGGRFTRGRP